VKPFIWLFSICLFLAAPLHAEPPSTFKETTATKELLQKLRLGGYVLYMRHGATDSSKPDRVPQVDLNDCSTQRPLTKEGRNMAALIGKSIRKAGIPFDQVVSSPLCRARESAKAAFGDDVQITKELMYTANMTTEEKKPILEATRRLLATSVTNGSNRIIVAHAPNLADVMGYFPKEGTVVIFLPKGGYSFEYIASIPPEAWHNLLK